MLEKNLDKNRSKILYIKVLSSIMFEYSNKISKIRILQDLNFDGGVVS